MTPDLMKDVREVKGCKEHAASFAFALRFPDCNGCLRLVQKFYGEKAEKVVCDNALLRAGERNALVTAIRRAFGVTT